MSVARPKLLAAPTQIDFNQLFTIDVVIPSYMKASSVQGVHLSVYIYLFLISNCWPLVSLMDLGFSTHAFHSSQRLVFMDAHLSPNKKTLTVRSPPNNRVYPPGLGNSVYSFPSCQFDDDFLVAFIFLTIDDITSEGAMVMVGSGASPPVLDQGIRI